MNGYAGFLHRFRISRLTKTGLILACCIYFAIFNIPTLILLFKNYLATDSTIISTLKTIHCIITLFLLNFLVCSIFRFHHITLKVWLCTLACVSSISMFFIVTDGVYFSRYLLYSIFRADAAEVTDIISVKPFIYLFFFGVIPCFAIWKVKIVKKGKKEKRYCLYAFFGILAMFAAHRLTFIELVVKNKSRQLPFHVVAPSVEFALFKLMYAKLDVDHTTTTDISVKYQIKPEMVSKKNDDLTVFLVIGESLRADRLGILGFNRQTTPKLESIKNLSAFTAESCATLTLYSVQCMLSRLNESEFSLPRTETSVVSVLKKLGFKSTIYSTNTMHREDRGISEIYREYDKFNDFKGQLDENIIGKIESELNSSRSRKFITLHSVGSHFQYYNRVPKNFGSFKPACDKKIYYCSKEEVQNAYDNTILYTDLILSKIIKTLSHKNAIFIYVSDHGESLGEYGIYKHGIPKSFAPDAQKKVPFIIWTSDTFNAKNPEVQKKIKSLHSSNTQLSHDHLFHTILGCIGVKSNIIDNAHNICK